MAHRCLVVIGAVLLVSAWSSHCLAGILDRADPKSSDLYLRLGVTPDATLGEMTAQYRKLAKVYHPDKVGIERVLFQNIDDAYRILKDPERRYDYDRHRRDPALLRKYNPSEVRSARWRPKFNESAAQPKAKAGGATAGMHEDSSDLYSPTYEEKAYFKDLGIPANQANVRLYRLISVSGYGRQSATSEQWASFQKIRSKDQLDAISGILKIVSINNAAVSPRVLDKITGMTDEKKLRILTAMAQRIFNQERNGKFLSLRAETISELASIGPEKEDLLDALRESGYALFPEAIQVLAQIRTPDQERALYAVISPELLQHATDPNESDALLLHRVLDITPNQLALLEELKDEGYAPLSALKDGNLEIFKNISNLVQARALALLTKHKAQRVFHRNYQFGWKGMDSVLQLTAHSQLQVLWAIEKKKGNPNEFMRPPYLEEILRAKSPRVARALYERIMSSPVAAPETLFPNIHLTQSLHKIQDTPGSLLSCLMKRMSGKK